MALDWLYGPKSEEVVGGLNFRPVRLDAEDLADIANYAKDLLEKAGCQNVQATVGMFPDYGGELTPMDTTNLDQLSAYDKAKLYISVRSLDVIGSIDIDTRQGWHPNVRASIFSLPNGTTSRDIETMIVKRILADGEPIAQWPRLYRFAPYIAFAALAASMIWTQATSALTAATATLGWLIVAFALVGTIALSRTIHRTHSTLTTGCRIRPLNRQTIRANRANSKRDLKVAGLTFIVTAAAGVLVAAIVYALNLNADHPNPTQTPAATAAPAPTQR